MNQQPGTLRTHRKLWVAGSIAAIAAAVAIAFGMGGIPRGEDVNGTVTAAERYRAPQAATQDVQLGDMSVAQLLQNDAFLKLIKDPEVQRMVVEPGFLPASQLILDNPEAARQALTGRIGAQATDAQRVLALHAAAANLLIANPEANRAMHRQWEAVQRFVSADVRAEADRSAAAKQGAERQVRLQTGGDAVANVRKAGGLAPELKARLQGDDAASNRQVNLQTNGDAVANVRKAGGLAPELRARLQGDDAASSRQVNLQTNGDAVANVRKAGGLAPELKARLQGDDAASNRQVNLQTGAVADMRKSGGGNASGQGDRIGGDTVTDRTSR